MATYELYQVDAFTSELFSGNPAAVVKLDSFFPDALMQQLAMENNLSETAFVVPRPEAGHYDLRWFTPQVEIPFCGHATVATAHVLAEELGEGEKFHFHAKVGELIVTRNDDMYALDAPIYPFRDIELTEAVRAAFPVSLDSAFLAADNLYVVFEHESDVRNIEPDMARVKPLSEHGVGITARAAGKFDCVSRLFFPAIDLAEDPVTGSAHAAIGPYWAKRLGQSRLTAYQASKRGGILYLDIGDKRLTISGQAVTYMKGEFKILSHV